jgi:hypothetical protein
MKNHPELVPVFIGLAFCAVLFVIAWTQRPKPIRWPDDRWFERLAMWGVRHWEDAPNASAFAAAIARAGEWCFNAVTNHRLMAELDEVHGRLGHLLCEASGGRASKTNYSSETMSGLVQEYQEDMVNDRLVDALADLPNYEFPWGKIKLLCQYMEVSEGEVSERRRMKKEMAKLVAESHRERKRAVKAALKAGSDPVLAQYGITEGAETQAERNARADREADTAHAQGYLASDQH